MKIKNIVFWPDIIYVVHSQFGRHQYMFRKTGWHWYSLYSKPPRKRIFREEFYGSKNRTLAHLRRVLHL